MGLHALRYYPFSIKADTIAQKAFAVYDEIKTAEERHQKTSIQLVAGKEFLETQIQSIAAGNQLIYTYLILPYLPWMQYATPLNADDKEMVLSIGLQEDQQNDAIYGFLGKQNVHFLIDKLLSESNLFHPKIVYHYFLAGEKNINGQELYEIAFYPENTQKNAFTGLLYVTADGNNTLVKILYTRSNPYAPEPVRKVLWTQTFDTLEGKTFPIKKEAIFTLGDVVRGGLLVNQTTYYTDSIEPLTVSEQQTAPLVQTAEKSRAFRNLQNVVQLGMADRLTIGGPQGIFEWTPVTQSVSFNSMEGLRLRGGGNTTTRLTPHFLFGGYVAYGTKDNMLKYRGDLMYSLLPKDRDIWEFPKRLFSLSYVSDLNIPGQNLLNNQRDAIYNSFSRSAKRMSLQKMTTIDYEHEWANHLLFRLGVRHLYDRPMGEIQYDAITVSEIRFGLGYSSGKIFMQNRNERIYFRHANLEWDIQHRVGLKNVFGSNYQYHITNFDLSKRWYFPRNAGYGDVRFSAGKVWNRVPFPLLFVPKGGHSYLFSNNKYNTMQVYEFVTDQFVAGQVDFQFNWSPFRLFFRNNIKTTWGIKALYGSISNNNQPTLPQGVNLLNNTPYTEMHIGFTRIFNLLRVEWVQRMTYGERGVLLFGISF